MPASLVCTPEPLNSPPRVRLDVTLPAGGVGVSVYVTRVGSDGRTVPVRTADPAVMTGSAWVGYDYEAPYGALQTYSASVVYDLSGTPTTDVATDTATVDVTDVWLIHPGVPDLSMRLDRIKAFGDRIKPVARGVFEPFGRSLPIIVTDGKRKAVQSQLVFRTRTLDETAALVALTADAATLLLIVPESLEWGIGAEYISLGDLPVARDSNVAADPDRVVAAPYLVTSRPIGGSQSQRTWADLMAECATWQDVMDMYPTWLDVLAPTT